MINEKIPTSPQDVSPEWLTRALRAGGVIDNAAVTSFTSKVIGEGVGLLGQLAQLTLTYDKPEAGGPASLIAKLPATSEENRYIANLFRFYEREVRFYEEVAGSLDCATARCYYSQIDADSGDFVLLLEDLCQRRVGDQVRGCSEDEVRLALDQLATLHAAWWESPRLEELDWLPYANAPIHHSAESSYQQAWEPLIENFGSRLSPYVMKTADRLRTNVINCLNMLAEPPRTIVHGDYRCDNLFFRQQPDQPEFTVIDWQISCRGRGAYDLGYFLSQSVEPDIRRAVENDVLRAYHQALLDGGVRGYSFEGMYRDYRISTLYCFVYPGISGGSLDLSNERGVALVTAMLDRSAAAIEDLKAGDILPD